MAEPCLVGSCTLVAVMITVLGIGTTLGATYVPLLPIVPTVRLPPGIPFTAQTTVGSVAPVTAALNRICPPGVTLAELGVTVTTMGEGGLVTCVGPGAPGEVVMLGLKSRVPTGGAQPQSASASSKPPPTAVRRQLKGCFCAPGFVVEFSSTPGPATLAGPRLHSEPAIPHTARPRSLRGLEKSNAPPRQQSINNNSPG